ncbi:MAG: RNA polymerase sigma-70 factor [Bacteroidales bacterium]|nr:RNA polymerase sigma-70 factor [Bacteroidales bacterium]
MINEDLVKRQLQKHSPQAFEAVFRHFHKELCNYIYKMVIDADEAQEIAQQCFVKLWEKRAEATQIVSLRAYLYRSAYNAAINRFRHDKIKQRYESEAQYLLEATVYEDFENTYTEDLTDKLKHEVENLPEKNKEVFKLRFYEGLNTVQVGEHLGISPRTVETHVSNAYKILREKLGHLLSCLLFFQFFL